MPDIFRLGYQVQMSASDTETAEVMLYGEIVEDGPKWWKWSEEDKSAADFDKAISDVIAKGAKNLTLRINSPGGICTESVAMRSILANAGFEKITIRIEGMCASAATNLATLPGAHVVISEGSEYMIHNPWCMAIGDANAMEHTISRLRNMEQMFREFYVGKTGQTEEQIKSWMDAETWFTADQAVKYGFADEIKRAEVKETPIAACVSAEAMKTMHSLYRTIPEQISVKKDDDNIINKNVSSGAAKAVPTEINKNIKEEKQSMEINEITLDQLREGNPDLLAQIQQSAVKAEQARMEEIDALTYPGYEALANQAKKDGTSAIDFQKQMVAAMKQKGKDFIDQRVSETKPAQAVSGSAPVSVNEDDEIKQNAKDIASYAEQYARINNAGMF